MVKNFDHEAKALTIQLDNWDCIYAEESNLADTLMHLTDADMYPEIGRASCRERV